MEGAFQRICLVHYHEIGLKGRNRSDFEKRLLSNLQALLCGYPIVTIHRISGRLCIFLKEGTEREVALSLMSDVARIPGVARVSCGFKCDRNIDEMKELAIEALRDCGDFKTFKVQARRNHTDFPINSMEMNQIIGEVLCDAFPDKGVRMKDPDITLGVEVIQNACYIYGKSIRAIGGLPVGVSGRVMALLSSGIDSPVALWRMARRGAVCLAVHFSGSPQTTDESEFLVDDIAHVLEESGCIARVYTVAFGDVQKQIALQAPPQLRVILYRRLMLKVAQLLAEKNKARALVTGESLGQVASQTLDNIAATDQAVTMPVLRPLIGSDKLEIIDQAQELGTFEISSQDAPDCCTLFMPRNPETHAKLPVIFEAEEALPIETWAHELADAARFKDYRCPAFKPRKHRDSE